MNTIKKSIVFLSLVFATAGYAACTLNASCAIKGRQCCNAGIWYICDKNQKGNLVWQATGKRGNCA